MKDPEYIKIYESLQTIYALAPGTHLCADPQTNRLFVVKEFDLSMLGTMSPLEGADIPNMPRVRHISVKNGFFEVMSDYVSGTPLSDILAERTVDPDLAAKYAADICEALASLHRSGLVHRDVNPNNIIITEGGRAMLIDYGIIRSFSEDKPKDTVILGTPGYAAPEQFGFTQSDAKTDIYAVGVLLNVMITGSVPGEKRADGYYGYVVERCTELDPAKRYGSAELLRKALLKHSGSFKEAVNRFFSYVPGIRSKNPALIIISAVFHIAAIWGTVYMCCVSVRKHPEYDVFETVLDLLGGIIRIWLPYTLVFNPAGVWNHLPLKKLKPICQRLIYIAVAILIVLIL